MFKNFSSAFHDIKLIITGTDEPNNGRMLWIADIYVNGAIQTEKYFGSWNRLNENLDKYVMDSPDGKYIYIPAEGGGFLIDTSSLEKINLPYKELSTLKFLRNEFSAENLYIFYTDECICIEFSNIFNNNRLSENTNNKNSGK